MKSFIQNRNQQRVEIKSTVDTNLILNDSLCILE